MFNISIADHFDSVSDFVANEIAEYIKENQKAILCLAGGNSPLKTYQKLVRKIKTDNINISQLTFVGLDEWIGLDGYTEGSSRNLLNTHLFEPLDISEHQIIFFNGKLNPTKECNRVSKRISELGGINLMLLGIGLNGHVGFNEPYTSTERDVHVVKLDDVTKKNSVNYFDKGTNAFKGITLGMKTILRCDKIIAIACGSHKSSIVRRILSEKIHTGLPVSLLKEHKNIHFLFDKDATKLILDG